MEKNKRSSWKRIEKKQKIFVEENRISDFRVCAIYGTYPKKYFRDGKSGTALNHLTIDSNCFEIRLWICAVGCVPSLRTGDIHHRACYLLFRWYEIPLCPGACRSYIRPGNNLDAQKAALSAAGATEIFVDTFTGTKMERPEFDRLNGLLKGGDTLIVTKLDRFARTV